MRVLETERLVLRWLEPGDAEFILELVNDPDWLRFIGDRGVRSLDDAHEYIRNGPAAMYARLGFGLFGVELRDEGTPIGICGLLQRDWLEDVDLGFALLPRFRAQGYAREAAEATLRYGTEVLGLARIAAIVSPENQASIRLLEKLGFRFQRAVQMPGGDQELSLFATPA